MGCVDVAVGGPPDVVLLEVAEYVEAGAVGVGGEVGRVVGFVEREEGGEVRGVVEAICVPERVGVGEGGEGEGGDDAKVGLAGAAEGFEEGWVGCRC